MLLPRTSLLMPLTMSASMQCCNVAAWWQTQSNAV